MMQARAFKKVIFHYVLRFLQFEKVGNGRKREKILITCKLLEVVQFAIDTGNKIINN